MPPDGSSDSPHAPATVSPEQVTRALRLSFVQAMLAAVFLASTGGMFLIGYAMRLGATDPQIGLMFSIPMYCVVMQLLSSLAAERGFSRRLMTFYASAAQSALWALIILIPFVGNRLPDTAKIALLIAIITLVTLFAHVAGNARGGWIGDLIPSNRRGFFFGRMGLYGGIIASIFAIIEGFFLDHVKNLGLAAFSLLFAFGMLFGLINAFLFLPQADVPLTPHPSGGGFLLRQPAETFANIPLRRQAWCILAWSAQGIAGPFYAAYILRDLHAPASGHFLFDFLPLDHVPFVGMAIGNAAVMISLLSSSPFWGRVVDRFGSRPVLITCIALHAPLPLVWWFIDSPLRFYQIIIPLNLAAGIFISGVSVASNTLIYRITPAAGRAVQLAIYSVVVTVLAAPFPALGGNLPTLLQQLGIHADLRATFYTQAFILVLAALLAIRLVDPGSKSTRDLVLAVPGLDGLLRIGLGFLDES